MEKYCKPNSTLREQPVGLCSTCRWYLYACQRGEIWEDVGRPDPRNLWDQFELQHGRFKEKDCPADCSICQLAKWNPVGEPELNADKRYLVKSKESAAPEKEKLQILSQLLPADWTRYPAPTPRCCKEKLVKLGYNWSAASNCLKPQELGFQQQHCIRGRYWEIHPRRPRDFPCCQWIPRNTSLQCDEY